MGGTVFVAYSCIAALVNRRRKQERNNSHPKGMNLSQSRSFSKMYQIFDAKEQERKAQSGYVNTLISTILSVLVWGQR